MRSIHERNSRAGRPNISPNKIALALSRTTHKEWAMMKSIGLASVLAGAGTLSAASAAYAQSPAGRGAAGAETKSSSRARA
jgi:hypothetical protein